MEPEDIQRIEREMEELSDAEHMQRLIPLWRPPQYESYQSVNQEYQANNKKEKEGTWDPKDCRNWI